MAGILNNKSRILDVVLTDIGREQMNRGEFKISYVTFSDLNAQYLDDRDEFPGCANSIDDLIQFEAFNSASDEIIPEISDEGDFILTQQVTPSLEVVDGILYEVSGSSGQYVEVDGFSNVDSFSRLTLDRFNSLQILRTTTDLANFAAAPLDFSFQVPQNAAEDNLPTLKSVDGLKPIRIDSRFSGNINTLFLPPIASDTGDPLQAYTMYHGDRSVEALVSEIKTSSLSPMHNTDPTMRVQLGTDETYEEYNILGQIFMKKDQSIIKLLLVDGGEFLDNDGVLLARIYHAGLIFKDLYGTSKFSRTLSLIFHNEETL